MTTPSPARPAPRTNYYIIHHPDGRLRIVGPHTSMEDIDDPSWVLIAGPWTSKAAAESALEDAKGGTS